MTTKGTFTSLDRQAIIFKYLKKQQHINKNYLNLP
jgi:hypothetical protein